MRKNFHETSEQALNDNVHKLVKLGSKIDEFQNKRVIITSDTICNCESTIMFSYIIRNVTPIALTFVLTSGKEK